jgi:hypothetical protein
MDFRRGLGAKVLGQRSGMQKAVILQFRQLKNLHLHMHWSFFLGGGGVSPHKPNYETVKNTITTIKRSQLCFVKICNLAAKQGFT